MGNKLSSTWVMIWKPNSLKLTCDLGNWVQITHNFMESYPGPNMKDYNHVQFRSPSSKTSSYDAETKFTKVDMWPWDLGQVHIYAILSYHLQSTIIMYNLEVIQCTSKTFWFMIQKWNSLKFTCDLGNWAKVTHMQSHPSPCREL